MAWTKQQVTHLIYTDVEALQSAMSILHDRIDASNEIRRDDVGQVRYYGKRVKSGKRITNEHVSIARNIAVHYAELLAKLANAVQ